MLPRVPKWASFFDRPRAKMSYLGLACGVVDLKERAQRVCRLEGRFWKKTF